MNQQTNEPWWKKAVVYQIYPKSFLDTTGSGTGDINGVTKKLDYIKELGADCIWLTPMYESPQHDNGYDISDYRKIHDMYGTMADFEHMLKEAHERGIRVIMDIAVNHTSIFHEWFQASRESKDNPYRDYYIWKEPKADGSPPNDWQSKFGGPAWELDEATGDYYLHLYDVTQADLNWEHDEVRKQVYDIMHFWFEKGIDGFRLDVINNISKDQRFLDDAGQSVQGDGRMYYTDGPRIHEFLHEMNQEVFSKYDSMTVGEMSSTNIADCIRYTRPDRQELDMTFNFHHLKVDYPNGEKWAIAPFDFLELKSILSEWQTKMHEGGGWNALFWCNHDQPRIVSRYGDDGMYHQQSAKMLATTIHLMQGTPYIYQGEEIGMKNPRFEDISSYRDIESLNMYEVMLEKGKTEEEALAILQVKSRDNARTPMQWTSEKNAGFSKGTPWIAPAKNDISVEAALKDRTSIFYHYQALCRLRKEYDVITYGSFTLLLPDDPKIFAYVREGQEEKILVINHFYAGEVNFTLPIELLKDADEMEVQVLLSNYEDVPEDIKGFTLRPYESIVYHLTKR
ncbi:alpha,alpha-phosphotrehalase [Bacillus xiamenensis]|uniref:Alpha,alpha-phosphotrehalase n=1 Tax=Bacillus xiamenensis TaxID=1178537 RepID=A0AAC9IGL1_9BACI|nr:alpha,alpha-phosphotrehalase [Bacillus xiamenensis]AOZ87989.1 alpha,alpha-phosphotrehalase [Bacillus xiamenensis]